MTALSRDQRRRKKLADRQKRLKSASAPPRLNRGRIAEAVHRAVCDYTGTDGFGMCALYAIAGMGLLFSLGERQTCIQVGAFGLQPNPADPTGWIVMDPAYGWGEIHAWLVHWTKPHPPGDKPVSDDVEIIDLSARHYRRYVEEMPSLMTPGIEPIEKIWRQGDVPTYLWATTDRLPQWVSFSAREEPTCSLIEEARNHKELIRLACRHYDNFGRQG